MAILAAAGAIALPAFASADRTISFYNIHTKETLTVQYKKVGKFVPEAMKQVNWILRDWRANQTTTMDPNTIDIIWEMHRELGSREPVHVISGYRSPNTNAMLRKTRGGQASKSQHMTGKAVDISFPDVPLKRMRYSAMVRERGGVGYYPTSGIPFVHVDTARVRHWPRMARDELALIFPAGRSKHTPPDGRPITLADVASARAKRKDLAQDVAQFFALRDTPHKPIMVADASSAAPRAAAAPAQPQKQATAPAVAALTAPAPTRAVRPPAEHRRMAVGAPMPPPEVTKPEAMAPVIAQASLMPSVRPPPAPRLVSAPKAVDRPSQFVNRLPDSERSRLDMLVQLASLEEALAPPPKPAPVTAAPQPKAAPMKAAAASAAVWPHPTGALGKSATPPTPAAAPDGPAHPLGPHVADWRSGWVSAPEYDEDHPEELAYRPFALAPLLTETASFDDPALMTLVHPDASQALAMIDDEGSALAMKFGPGHLETAMAWASAFKGSAVDLAGLAQPQPSAPAASAPQLVARAVKTEPR